MRHASIYACRVRDAYTPSLKQDVQPRVNSAYYINRQLERSGRSPLPPSERQSRTQHPHTDYTLLAQIYVGTPEKCVLLCEFARLSSSFLCNHAAVLQLSSSPAIIKRTAAITCSEAMSYGPQAIFRQRIHRRSHRSFRIQHHEHPLADPSLAAYPTPSCSSSTSPVSSPAAPAT